MRMLGRMVAEAVGFILWSAILPQGNRVCGGGGARADTAAQGKSGGPLSSSPETPRAACLCVPRLGLGGHGSAWANQVARGWGQGLWSPVGPQELMMMGRFPS